MKFLPLLLLFFLPFFLVANTPPKTTSTQHFWGLTIGLESARVIGHGPSMYSVGILPPSIGTNANILYANRVSQKKWGKEYSIGFSQRGFAIDRKSYIEDLSLDYLNIGLTIYKEYSNHTSLYLGGNLSYLLKATYQLGKSPTYNVKTNYKPIDINLNASYGFKITENIDLRLSQYIGLLPLDQENNKLELNNSTVLSFVFNFKKQPLSQ